MQKKHTYISGEADKFNLLGFVRLKNTIFILKVIVWLTYKMRNIYCIKAKIVYVTKISVCFIISCIHQNVEWNFLLQIQHSE